MMEGKASNQAAGRQHPNWVWEFLSQNGSHCFLDTHVQFSASRHSFELLLPSDLPLYWSRLSKPELYTKAPNSPPSWKPSTATRPLVVPAPCSSCPQPDSPQPSCQFCFMRSFPLQLNGTLPGSFSPPVSPSGPNKHRTGPSESTQNTSWTWAGELGRAGRGGLNSPAGGYALRGGSCPRRRGAPLSPGSHC